MIKSELIKKLHDKYQNLYLKDVTQIVEAVLKEMSDALVHDSRVEIRGFGTFSIRQRKPRTARNPKTKEKVSLDARRVIYFRAGKELRDRLNKVS